jgi:predicted NAD/FAD-binding protein
VDGLSLHAPPEVDRGVGVRIAVVGGGVAGLTAADRLAAQHDVVLFEAEARLGGHAHTVDVPGPTGSMAVDTGFIVFNRATYPNFVRWIDGLGVRTVDTDMSFSVRSDARDFEYGSAGLNALFAQRRHLVSPRFHRLWRDILRFYRESRELLKPERAEERLDDYVRRGRYSAAFIDDHLLPLVGAVWSSNRAGAREFPARLLVRFFEQHGFLRAGRGLRWLSVAGGSREYVGAVERRLRGRVRLNSPVSAVVRAESSVWVESPSGRETFDHVVLACHADQARRLVQRPTVQEQDILAPFVFQPNEAILHTDRRMMPRHRRAWAAWNYHLDDHESAGACVTYWMNRLQSLPGPKQLFVTLNRRHAIDPEQVIASFDYAHPCFTPASARAQGRHAELIDHHGLSYCGAWWRNGFHEDGVVSALSVCERLGVAA